MPSDVPKGSRRGGKVMMRRLSTIVVFVVLAGCGSASGVERPSSESPVEIASIPEGLASEPIATVVEVGPQLEANNGTAISSAETPASLEQSWQLDGDTRAVVAIVAPERFLVDPGLDEVTESDRANGLFVLHSWIDSNCGCTAAISVQRDPGDAAPVNQLEGADTLVVGLLVWTMVDFDPGDATNIVSFARIDGYLIELTSSDLETATLMAQSVSYERV
jgi:hypothetical protein